MLNLPYDIIQQIIPFTYSVQNKKLLADIKNFHDTKTSIQNHYKREWMNILDYEYDAYDWLINDVLSYANNYNAAIYGFTKSFYNIFRRLPRLKKTKDIDKYFSKIQKYNSNRLFNIVWGLLQEDERNEFCRENIFF